MEQNRLVLFALTFHAIGAMDLSIWILDKLSPLKTKSKPAIFCVSVCFWRNIPTVGRCRTYPSADPYLQTPSKVQLRSSAPDHVTINWPMSAWAALHSPPPHSSIFRPHITGSGEATAWSCFPVPNSSLHLRWVVCVLNRRACIEKFWALVLAIDVTSLVVDLSPHIRCTRDIGSHDAHIKSDSSISDLTWFLYLRKNTSPTITYNFYK
jgi:hypothetical protein